MLPHRLGLTRDDTGRWDELWVPAVNQDLPGYVADDPDRPSQLVVTAPALEHFRAAHHCAVFHCLIADRLTERQTPPDVRLTMMRDLLLSLWESELSNAMWSASAGRTALAAALGALQRGTRLERQALEQRSMNAAGYALQTRDKLQWGSTSAASLLRHAGHPARADTLERSYDRFCFALRCLDDAMDGEEDERTRGVSIPSLLQLPEGALVAAASPLLEGAIELAAAAHFERLAAWMGSFRQLLSQARVEGDPARNQGLGRDLAAAALKVL
jgi:hypothetical protein